MGGALPLPPAAPSTDTASPRLPGLPVNSVTVTARATEPPSPRMRSMPRTLPPLTVMPGAFPSSELEPELSESPLLVALGAGGYAVGVPAAGYAAGGYAAAPAAALGYAAGAGYAATAAGYPINYGR